MKLCSSDFQKSLIPLENLYFNFRKENDAKPQIFSPSYLYFAVRKRGGRWGRERERCKVRKDPTVRKQRTETNSARANIIFSIQNNDTEEIGHRSMILYMINDMILHFESTVLL